MVSGQKISDLSDFRTIRKLYVVKVIKCINKYNDKQLSESEIKKFAFDLEQLVLELTKDNCKDYGQLIYDDDGNYTKNFQTLYESIIGNHIISNLNKDNYIHNESLINKVLSKNITAEEIVSKVKKSPYELFPDKNKIILDEIKTREDIAYNKELNISSTYTCRNCKSNKCFVDQKQLKGADESMTTLVTCLNCNNKWQFG